MVLKSLSQRIECARMVSWCLGMIKECLGNSSMRLGVPFIARRQLGAVGTQQGRQFLPSVGWRTGQPLWHVRCESPSIPGVADRWIFGLVGAPDTVRCTPDSSVPLSIVGAGHASPADLAADRCTPPDRPVNYSRTPPQFFESGQFAGVQPGAPDTVRCARLSRILAASSQVLLSFSFL
jgi:hypothetical protein